MKNYRLALWGIVGLLWLGSTSCSQQTGNEQSSESTVISNQLTRSNFPNTLNLQGIPKDTSDLSVSSFSDMGAWHSFALPPEKDSVLTGKFIGPYLLGRKNGRWLSSSLMGLWVKDAKLQPITFQTEKSVYLPGTLIQELSHPDFSVTLQLIFHSSRTALVRAHVQNTSQEEQKLTVGWQGDVLYENTTLKESREGIQIHFKDQDLIAAVHTPTLVEVSVQNQNPSYDLTSETRLLAPQESADFFVAQITAFNQEEYNREKITLEEVWQQPNKSFEANEQRWNQYTQSLLNQVNTTDSSQQQLAVKALNTLMNNWRSPAGELLHDGLFPSYAYRGFHGFWAWDSWKHAAALSLFAPDLAKNQMRSMFDYQNAAGMIPDCIFRDTLIEKHNWRDTKPPLSAWAVWKIYEQDQDTSFIKEMFPKLIKYHQWWYQDRDHNQNQIAEYGSTDGTRIAAAWESGMDNAVRFDQAEMLKNHDTAWSLNQESVDLNAFLSAEKNYLIAMAGLLRENTIREQLQKENQELIKVLQKEFYDSASGYFYDRTLTSQALIKVQGPEAWIPLWAKIATQTQAKKTAEIIVNKDKFSTYLPFPTLAADHSEFDPTKGYWRGPVWLDQAWFALKGMKNYGFASEADSLATLLFSRAEGLMNSPQPIRENYHPINGKGLNAHHFSWSAAHILLWLTEE
ncbi:trehalase family glycosidase [Rapidithrix thailandica]|uniref:Trehalase family glycosidase n=1 Tax=Rapidithrix thailandica TaxID=413964 RepID=A0AAW9RWD1_9BACT